MKRFSQVDYNDVKSMAQSVDNERLKDGPSLPKSTADVLAALRDFQQTDKSLQVLVNDESSEIVMISSAQNLSHLQASTNIYADRTFSFAPKHFFQLYTIHAFLNGQYAPCVYFLLPNKKEQTYSHMINLLKIVSEEIASIDT